METQTQMYIPYSTQIGGLHHSPTIDNMSDPKERFYRHFQTEITEIQDQIAELASLSNVNGERQDCIDTVLAGISRLSNEVTDALDFIPAYDQRAYSQAIKALTEKLNEATGKLAPKSRFQFKPRAAKTEGAESRPDTRQRFQNPFLGGRNGAEASANPEDSAAVVETSATSEEDRDAVSGLPARFAKNYNEEMSRPGISATSVRKPSFSSARNIAIYSQEGLHIILPSSASRATSSGSLTDLNRCIVDMTVPTSTSSNGTPFAGLAIKNVRGSLLICGTVAGAVHITGVRDSVVVVAARQVRVHECQGVDLYLWCGSHPIIEDCRDMRFAPLPEIYSGKTEELGKNQWDQVDDFKWLKSEPSPNWSKLPDENHIADDVWAKDVNGNSSLSTEGILKKVGVIKP